MEKIFLFSICLMVFVQASGVASECKVPSTKPDFDVTKYLGDWYQVFGKVDSGKPVAKCTRAQYSDLGEGKVKVRNNGIYVEDTVLEICGVATIPDPEFPGILEVDFPTTPSPPAPYYVLDTDYENWASVFTCSEARPEGTGYVLFRSTVIDVDALTEALLPFLLNDIDVSEFVEFPQPSDCIYEPEVPDPSCQ